MGAGFAKGRLAAARSQSATHPQLVFISFSKHYEADLDERIGLVGKRPD
jgi:hypothetical protein